MKILKIIKRIDVIIILLLLVAAVILSAALKHTQDGGGYAEIIYGGNVVRMVDLSKDCTFSVSELPHIVFEVKDNKIAFMESDCPDKICVKTGFISKAGQTAACLPNKTIINITANSDIDTMIY